MESWSICHIPSAVGLNRIGSLPAAKNSTHFFPHDYVTEFLQGQTQVLLSTTKNTFEFLANIAIFSKFIQSTIRIYLRNMASLVSLLIRV